MSSSDESFAWKGAYEETDKEVCKQLELRAPKDISEFRDIGATAVTVVIGMKDEKRTLFVANVGDARAVLWYAMEMYS